MLTVRLKKLRMAASGWKISSGCEQVIGSGKRKGYVGGFQRSRIQSVTLSVSALIYLGDTAFKVTIRCRILP